MSLLNCGSDLQEPKESSAKSKTFLRLKDFEYLANQEDKQVESWVIKSGTLLNIKKIINSDAVEKNSEQLSSIEQVTKSTLDKGKKVSNAMWYVNRIARLGSYVGVPAAAFIADVTSYNTSLSSIVYSVKSLQPSVIKGNIVGVKNFLLEAKNKTLGLNNTEKNALIEKLKNITTNLGEAKEIIAQLNELSDKLEVLVKEIDRHSGAEIYLVKIYSKNRFLKLAQDIEIISQLSHSLLETGNAIALVLEGYKKDSSAVHSAIEKLHHTNSFVKSLPTLHDQAKNKIKRLFPD